LEEVECGGEELMCLEEVECGGEELICKKLNKKRVKLEILNFCWVKVYVLGYR